MPGCLGATISPDDLDLEATIAVQAAVITALLAQVASLEEANAALAARVVGLERRLGRDSSNSSTPPSQDGLRKPPRPARGGQGGRKPGKQPGVPGGHLAQVAEPDEVIVHPPERCASCGAGLADAAVTGVEARQVVDLPEVCTLVTEHRVQQRRCPCGQVTTGVSPSRCAARSSTARGARARLLPAGLAAPAH